MQKINFLLVKKLKSTESAQSCLLQSATFEVRQRTGDNFLKPINAEKVHCTQSWALLLFFNFFKNKK